jgi:Ca2+-binding EF-hand superfamily protein
MVKPRTIEEILPMTRTIAILSTLAALSTAVPAFAADPFSTADANGDGALDKTEFKTFIDAAAAAGASKAAQVKSHNMYARAFSRIDKNGDGVITKDEVAAMR